MTGVEALARQLQATVFTVTDTPAGPVAVGLDAAADATMVALAAQAELLAREAEFIEGQIEWWQARAGAVVGRSFEACQMRDRAAREIADAEHRLARVATTLALTEGCL